MVKNRQVVKSVKWSGKNSRRKQATYKIIFEGRRKPRGPNREKKLQTDRKAHSGLIHCHGPKVESIGRKSFPGEPTEFPVKRSL